jgi:hypothetical protein
MTLDLTNRTRAGWSTTRHLGQGSTAELPADGAQ